MTSDSKWTEEGGKIHFLSTGNSIYLKKKVRGWVQSTQAPPFPQLLIWNRFQTS